MVNPAPVQSLTVAADDREYPGLRAFIEKACIKTDCSASQALRILLVIEELFTNTVKYGKGGPAPVEVTVAIAATNGDITVTYENNAPPYDPFSSGQTTEGLDGTISKRSVGQLGLILVRELGENVHYARIGDRNRITFTPPADTLPGTRSRR
jgi:serine/threonine-protein kinase RsbW